MAFEFLLVRRRQQLGSAGTGRLPTSRLLVGVIGLLIGAGVVGVAWFLVEDDGGSDGDGRVSVSYEPGPREEVELIQRSGVFDHVAETVNREIAQPRDLQVRVIGGETAERLHVFGPTYEPRDHTVYFPWSFIASSHNDLKQPRREADGLRHRQADEVLANAMQFVLYHEISHGLFAELDTPIVAGEERTADSLATILSLRAERNGDELPLSAAVLELARAEQLGPPSIADYASDHGFDRQRAADARCAAYGSAPEENRHLVTGGALPPQRAELCEFDYEAQLRGWRQILEANLTDEGGLQPLNE